MSERKETVFREVWEGMYFQEQSQIICERNLSAGEKEFFYWVKFISSKEYNDVFYTWPWLYILRHAHSGPKVRNIYKFLLSCPKTEPKWWWRDTIFPVTHIRKSIMKSTIQKETHTKKKKNKLVGQLGIPWEQAYFFFLTTTLSLFIKALELIWLNG